MSTELTMSYAQMNDDASAPAGMVARRKKDGSVFLSVLPGGDEESNDSLTGLRYLIRLSGGLTTFIDSMKVGSAEKGIPIHHLVALHNAGADFDAVVGLVAQGKSFDRVSEALKTDSTTEDVMAAIDAGTVDSLIDEMVQEA